MHFEKHLFRVIILIAFSDIFSNITIVGAINKLSLVFPDSPPLTQPRDIDETKLCHDDKWPEHCRSNKELCPCVHVLKVKENSLVELIVVDESECNAHNNNYLENF